MRCSSEGSAHSRHESHHGVFHGQVRDKDTSVRFADAVQRVQLRRGIMQVSTERRRILDMMANSSDALPYAVVIAAALAL